MTIEVIQGACTCLDSRVITLSKVSGIFGSFSYSVQVDGFNNPPPCNFQFGWLAELNCVTVLSSGVSSFQVRGEANGFGGGIVCGGADPQGCSFDSFNDDYSYVTVVCRPFSIVVENLRILKFGGPAECYPGVRLRVTVTFP
jgi:hypothetical protein